MTTDHRDVLESELRALASVRDPVPAEVVEAALAAFTMRNLDAELAELTYDSFTDERRLAGVRGSGATRQLTFEAPNVVLDVQIELAAEARIMGQITPSGPTELEIRHSRGTMSVPIDARGQFAVRSVPFGPMSIRLRKYADGRSLATMWVAV